MASIKTVAYQVKKQDSLWNIVKANGFPPNDWKKVYDAPYNARLKKERPDPNVIFPGDVVYLPKYKPGDAAEVAKKIDSAITKLQEVKKRRGQLGVSVQRFLKSQEPGLKQIETLKKEVATLEDRIDQVVDACGEWECSVGATPVVADLEAQAKKLRAEIAQIKEKTSWDQGVVERITRRLEELGREEEALARELRDLSAEWKAVAARPY